jgi:uncharacterized protein YlxW (UPF0749 family)
MPNHSRRLHRSARALRNTRTVVAKTCETIKHLRETIKELDVAIDKSDRAMNATKIRLRSAAGVTGVTGANRGRVSNAPHTEIFSPVEPR